MSSIVTRLLVVFVVAGCAVASTPSPNPSTAIHLIEWRHRSVKPKSCKGQRLTAKRGRVTSPNYPDYYPKRVDCEWYIKGSKGSTITISFSAVDIGPVRKDSTSCLSDYVEIGPTAPNRKPFRVCGKRLPLKPFISFKSSVWVKFHSDSSVHGRGFSFDFIAGKVPAKSCRPDEFRCLNKKCVLNKWRCNGVDECGDASDEKFCRNETFPLKPRICSKGKFGCISDLTRTVECFSDSMKCNGFKDCLNGWDEKNCAFTRDPFQFHSDTCGGKIQAQSGWIATPGYPHNDYPNDASCSWYLTVNPGHVIQLNFLAFELDQDVNSKDYVEVYTGEKRSKGGDITDFKKIGKFTGTSTPHGYLKTLSNTAVIKFVSDSHGVSVGFNLTFQMDGICRADLVSCDDETNTCYDPLTERCDGVIHCSNGNDEKGCRGYNKHNCSSTMIPCASVKGCFPERDLCNGIGHCFDNSDENSCTALKCNAQHGTFLCKNKKCIYESWKCDNTNDCTDNSDEEDCTPALSIRVVTAAVIGSLICGLLLVIALGCTCKLYALRMADVGSDRFHRSGRGNRNGNSYRRMVANASSPLSRLEAEIFRAREAPPSYNAAMGITDPYEEAHSVFLDQIRLMLSLRRNGGGGGTSGSAANAASSSSSTSCNGRGSSSSSSHRRRDRERRHAESLRGRRSGSRSGSSRSQWSAAPVPSRPLVPPTWPPSDRPSRSASIQQIPVRGNSSRDGLGLSPGQFMLPLATTTLSAGGRGRRSRSSEQPAGRSSSEAAVINAGGATNPAYLDSLEGGTPLALFNTNSSSRFEDSHSPPAESSSSSFQPTSSSNFSSTLLNSSGVVDNSEAETPKPERDSSENSERLEISSSVAEDGSDARLLEDHEDGCVADDLPLIDDVSDDSLPVPSFSPQRRAASATSVAAALRPARRPPPPLPAAAEPPLPPRRSSRRPPTIVTSTPAETEESMQISVDASSVTTADSNSVTSSENGNTIEAASRPRDADQPPLLFPRRPPSSDSSSCLSSIEDNDDDDDEMPLF